MMTTSQNGVRLTQAFESCLKKVGPDEYRTYHCPADVLTIGWGTTRSDVPSLQEGEVWSKTKCDLVFANSLGRYETAVRKLGPMEQYEFDAFLTFTYNVGVGGLDGSVGRAFREGRKKDVPVCMARWNKCNGKVLSGLVRRRKAEGELFQGKIATAFATAQAAPPQAMPQAIDLPKPSIVDAAKSIRGQVATAAAVGTAAATGTVIAPQDQASTVVASSGPPQFSLSTADFCVGVGIIAVVAAAVAIVIARKRLALDWA